MSPLETTFLLVTGGSIGIATSVLCARVRTQLFTRHWLRYLHDSMPANSTLPVAHHDESIRSSLTECGKRGEARSSTQGSATRHRAILLP